MSSFQLQRLGQVMEPEPDNPLEADVRSGRCRRTSRGSGVLDRIQGRRLAGSGARRRESRGLLMSSDPVLAYQSDSFLDSDDGLPLRILVEYLQPLQAFQRERVHDTIVFFGRHGCAKMGRSGATTRRCESSRAWSRSCPCLFPATRIASSCAPAAGAESRRPRTAERPTRAGAPSGSRSDCLTSSGRTGTSRRGSGSSSTTSSLKLWFAHLARAMVAFPVASEHSTSCARC